MLTIEVNSVVPIQHPKVEGAKLRLEAKKDESFPKAPWFTPHVEFLSSPIKKKDDCWKGSDSINRTQPEDPTIPLLPLNRSNGFNGRLEEVEMTKTGNVTGNQSTESELSLEFEEIDGEEVKEN